MNIIIFGPQGSGKGTQANALSTKLNIPQITMGDLLRAEVASNSALGEQLKAIMNQGSLVPNEVTATLLEHRLKKDDCQNGFILDGYPRNLVQAQTLDALVHLDTAMEIWISDEEALSRIGGRRSCPKCGTIFHLITNPSKTDNVCDKCGTALIIREDDKEEVIKKRLAVYHEQTEPLVAYYQTKGIYLKIDGRPSIAEVNKEVFAKLNIA
ncbi:MAG: adenylate kinase [Patescibacteria group bacterium]|jgi:adenylate kinase